MAKLKLTPELIRKIKEARAKSKELARRLDKFFFRKARNGKATR